MAAPIPVVKVYHGTPMLPDVSRVLACLKEKDVKFELVDMNKGKHMTTDLIKFQASRAPISGYEDESTRLFESRAICRHIVDKYADRGNKYLLGRDLLERASIEQWLKSEEHSFDPPSWTLIYHLAFDVEPDRALITQSERMLSKVLDVYEQRLSESKYLGGEEFSLADLSHLPNSYYLERSREWGHLFKSRPHVRNWWELISGRSSWQDVVKILKEHGLLKEDSKTTPKGKHLFLTNKKLELKPPGAISGESQEQAIKQTIQDDLIDQKKPSDAQSSTQPTTPDSSASQKQDLKAQETRTVAEQTSTQEFTPGVTQESKRQTAHEEDSAGQSTVKKPTTVPSQNREENIQKNLQGEEKSVDQPKQVSDVQFSSKKSADATPNPKQAQGENEEGNVQQSLKEESKEKNIQQPSIKNSSSQPTAPQGPSGSKSSLREGTNVTPSQKIDNATNKAEVASQPDAQKKPVDDKSLNAKRSPELTPAGGSNNQPKANSPSSATAPQGSSNGKSSPQEGAPATPSQIIDNATNKEGVEGQSSAQQNTKDNNNSDAKKSSGPTSKTDPAGGSNNQPPENSSNLKNVPHGSGDVESPTQKDPNAKSSQKQEDATKKADAADPSGGQKNTREDKLPNAENSTDPTSKTAPQVSSDGKSFPEKGATATPSQIIDNATNKESAQKDPNAKSSQKQEDATKKADAADQSGGQKNTTEDKPANAKNSTDSTSKTAPQVSSDGKSSPEAGAPATPSQIIDNATNKEGVKGQSSAQQNTKENNSSDAQNSSGTTSKADPAGGSNNQPPENSSSLKNVPHGSGDVESFTQKDSNAKSSQKEEDATKKADAADQSGGQKNTTEDKPSNAKNSTDSTSKTAPQVSSDGKSSPEAGTTATPSQIKDNATNKAAVEGQSGAQQNTKENNSSDAQNSSGATSKTDPAGGPKN